MRPLAVYTLAQCDTCRRAVRWLRARGLEFEERPIRETPPRATELKRALAAVGGDRRRLFNTAGREYRALGLAAKLPALGEAEAIALLAANGSLVKRPFLVGPGITLVGFDEAGWAAALGP
ncbi:MAG TPA: Spx/MgsR family RNA polymerase-binding regulatory protein [Lacunisphaera sp.]|nr:Spx/MgsR family RNA polymerase-binding regulatory protein [Lacunisphaera sp.]